MNIARSRRTASSSSRGGPIDEARWQDFAAGLFFAATSIDEAHGFAGLGSRLDVIEHERGLPGNRVYYLAIPPSLFAVTVDQLARARFVPPADDRFARVIIEKPIGHDLTSAMAINDDMARVFTSSRSSGSITTSARRPSRTSW